MVNNFHMVKTDVAHRKLLTRSRMTARNIIYNLSFEKYTRDSTYIEQHVKNESTTITTSNVQSSMQLYASNDKIQIIQYNCRSHINAVIQVEVVVGSFQVQKFTETSTVQSNNVFIISVGKCSVTVSYYKSISSQKHHAWRYTYLYHSA